MYSFEFFFRSVLTFRTQLTVRAARRASSECVVERKDLYGKTVRTPGVSMKASCGLGLPGT